MILPAKKIIIVYLLLYICYIGRAQVGSIVHAPDVVGAADTSTGWMLKRLYAMKGVSRSHAASLGKSLAAQLRLFFKSPQLNPPKGFSTKIFLGLERHVYPEDAAAPSADVHISMYYMNRYTRTGVVKVSMDGTGIVFMTNGIRSFLSQRGNFWRDCDKLKIPLFFEQLPITDSTADYIELNFSIVGNNAGEPIRIVKRNNKPLFIPYTRKEYLQYLILRENNAIDETRQTIRDEQSRIGEARKNASNPANRSIKEALENAVTTMEKQITDMNASIGTRQGRLAHFGEILKGFGPAEAAAGVRLDENRKAEEFFGIEQIVPYGRHEGIALYKINPDYFDRSPGAPGAQLIIVYYNIPHVSAFVTDPDYLQQKTVDIFNQLDFSGLRESMQ
jgi:hypothetical protein